MRGPNVMKEYLSRPEKTAEVLRDGWYNTGDIATMDGDGFVWITDRLPGHKRPGDRHSAASDLIAEEAAIAIIINTVRAAPAQ